MPFDQAALERHTRENMPEACFDSLRSSPVTGGGSGRIFYRLECLPTGGTFIVMHYNHDRSDNRRFVPVTRMLQEMEVAVPKLYAHDENRRLIWLEDLGEDDLWLHREFPWEHKEALYRQTLDEAWKLHRVAETCLPLELEPPFDERLYHWEQHYFTDHFLRRYSTLPKRELEELIARPEWDLLAKSLAKLPRYLVHRDFQSRNVMIANERAYLIDYQGLRWGRPEYDLASILLDPYVDLPAEEQESLLRYYHSRYREDSWEQFLAIYHRCAAQRLMQALGAYGNLGHNLGKTEFLEHIPTGVERLRNVLAEGDILPGLQDALVHLHALA